MAKNITLPRKLERILNNPEALFNAMVDNPEIEKMLRRYYSQERSVAKKRLDRLVNSEFSDTEIVQENRKGFSMLFEIGSPKDLAHEIAGLHRFLNNRMSTVSGQRKKQKQTIKTLQESGYTNINEGNIKAFGEFMSMFQSVYDKAKYFYPSHILEDFLEAGVDNKSSKRAINAAFTKWAKENGYKDSEIVKAKRITARRKSGSKRKTKAVKSKGKKKRK